MEILLPELELPELQFQYTYEAEKYLRIYSGVLEPFLVEQLVQGKIRMQVWLERDQYKACGKNRKKRSWVHSRDYSGKAPSKLFSADEYDYGGGKGWGWGTIDGAEIPGYTTTNGCVPTEFEITGSDIINGRIIKEIPVLDIFSNVLKSWDYSTYGQNGHDVNRLAILGRKRSKSQPLRVRFAVNNRGKAFFGNPSNTVIMTISKAACEINPEVFNPAYIGRFIKMSCYK